MAAAPQIEDPGRVYYTESGVPASRPILTGAAAKPTFDKIPEIDISSLYSSDPQIRAALAMEIGQKCREVGFFIATNPPVSPATIDRAFAAVKEFFNLPLQEKNEIQSSQSAAAKGFDSYLTDSYSHANGCSTPAGRESWGFGNDYTELEQQMMTGKVAPPGSRALNQWPDKVPELRKAMYDYYSEVYPFAKALVRVFAVALGLSEVAFDKAFECPLFDIGVLHRLPTAPPAESQVNHPAHGDFSTFTLLCQNGVSGLQVLNANGIWIDAPATKYSYVVNTGTYLTLTSNGAFPSTIHRVVNTTGEERLSLPFFLSPDPSTILAPVADAQMPTYESILVSQKHVSNMFGRRPTHPTVAWFKKQRLEREQWRWEMLHQIELI